jgi:NADH:ubiquinone reductase (H+-translocating)
MALPKTHRIVIIGGGFAGSKTVSTLRRRLPPGWEIILYSQENYFVFTPLLAEVVGMAISPFHVVCPIRWMYDGVSCRTARIVGLDFTAREVIFQRPDGELGREPYDHLVLAVGLATNLDIVPGMARHGWPLKTLGDAIVLGNRIIEHLERAQVAMDPQLKARLLSFVVVGGGITGIEIAGAMAHLLREGCRYYDRIDPKEIRVTVIQGGPRILEQFPESLSSFADRKIREQGIDIRTQVRAEKVTVEGIQLKGGEFIEAGTVVAAVGSTIQPLLAGVDLPIERNRIKVTPEMRVEGHDNVWALGDCAAVPNALDGSISPTLGQFAIRQGKQLANNLLAVIGGRAPQPFRYRMEGMFANIGHNNAVGLVFGIHFSGFLASICWRGIYWAKMPTLTRKMQVGFDWLLDLFSRPNIVGLETITTERIAHIDADALRPFFEKHPEIRELRVGDVMSRPVATLNRNVTIAEAIHRVREQGAHAFPIVDDQGQMEGICTRGDLYRALGSLRSPDTPVREIMKSPVITVREDGVFDEAIRLAVTYEIRRLVVVSGTAPNRPAGMLTPLDVVNWYIAGRSERGAGVSAHGGLR